VFEGYVAAGIGGIRQGTAESEMLRERVLLDLARRQPQKQNARPVDLRGQGSYQNWMTTLGATLEGPGCTLGGTGIVPRAPERASDAPLKKRKAAEADPPRLGQVYAGTSFIPSQ
jgi:hypothetical protein